jgi:hypothetical protein
VTTEVFSAAIDYVEKRRWSVIPLRPNSKQPAIEWREFQNRRATLEELEDWFSEGDANIAIVTGKISGIVVLDLDGVAGEESIQGRETPPTTEVRTPNGRHLYFAYPENGKAPTVAVGILPCVDVRGDGGYVVAPPSRVNGSSYEPVGIFSREYAPIPAWFASASAAATRRKVVLGNEAPIPEHERNSTLTSLAGTMRRRGMGVAEIEAALLVTNADRCQPKLSEDEVRKIAASIGRYEPAAGNRPVTEATPWPWTSPGEEAGADQEEEAIVADLVYPGSKTLCISLPKVGKSEAAIQMSAAIRRGEPFLGRTVEPCNILYLTEEPRATFAAKLERAGIEEHDDGFKYLRRGMAGVAGRPWPEIVAETHRYAAEIGAEFVIVDVLHRWAGFKDGGENASDKVNEAISELTPLSEAGIAVWILAHSPWGEKRVRGSTDIFGAVDDGWFIDGVAGSDQPRRISWSGGRHEPQESGTSYRLGPDGRLESLGDQSVAQASRTDRVVTAVRELGAPSPTVAVAEALDISEWTARRWLDRALRFKFVARDTGERGEHLWRPRRAREYVTEWDEH